MRTDSPWFAAPGRAVALLVLAASAVRVALAVGLGLGIDESYMVAAGRQWQWGYFDHPPLAWWLSHGMAVWSGTEAGWLLRLPFIALFAVTTWLMFRLGAAMFGERAGMWAAVALTFSPVFGLASGGWVLPDGPLDCALAAAALCLVRALQGGAWRWWLAAGGAAGCALLSKYSAALILAGALAFLLTAPDHRRWLRRPQPYVAAALALVLFAPVLAWNAGHDWVSFAFQGGRAGVERFNPLGPPSVLGGEALFVLPWIWFGLMVALWRALRGGAQDWRGWLLACLGVGPVLLFVLVGAWSRHVLFHWAAPGYLMLFPLLGREMERWSARRAAALRWATVATAAFTLAALALAASELQWNWRRLPPDRDPALQALDWSGLDAELAAEGLSNAMPIAATGWQEAGKIAYALGPAWPVICLNRDARQFGVAGGGAIPSEAAILSSRWVSKASLAAQGFTADQLDRRPTALVHLPGGRVLELWLFIAHGLRRSDG